MTDFYGEDLAAIHAEGFGQLAAAAAAEVLSRLGPVADGAQVLDLGCGAGALSEALAREGFRVWGADISAAFVALARARVPEGEFVEGSIFELELPAARAACAVGEVVNYLADRAADEAGLARFFARVHDALEPGGLLLFDAAAPGRAAGGTRAFTEGADWAVGALAHEREGVLVRRITSFRRADAGGWRRSFEEHRLRLWPPELILAGLEATGFRAEAGDSYADLKLPPGLIRYAAVKAR